MRHFYHARKRRQLGYLSRELKQLLRTGENETGRSVKLKRKILQLIKELKQFIRLPELKKMIGGVAVFLGISFGNHSSAQVFGLPQFNPFGLTPVKDIPSLATVDLDGDGDFDMIIGGSYGSFNYFENTGTLTAPQFDSVGVNPFGLTSTYYFSFVATADLDNDGDYDILAGEYYGAWQYFENTGSASSPAFAAPVANPFGLSSVLYIGFPALADLDNDGDYDLMAGEYYGGLKYFENVGTASSPMFDPPITTPFGLTAVNGLAIPAFADFDNDGDQDLFVGESYGNIIYFENVGTALVPDFSSTPQANPFGIQQAYYIGFSSLADMDNDGDTDLFVGEYYGNIKYYEQVDPAGFSEKENLNSLNVYPNPTSDFLTISSRSQVVTVEVYDQQGKLVMQKSNKSRISLVTLTPGNYLVKIIDVDGNFETTQVVKK